MRNGALKYFGLAALLAVLAIGRAAGAEAEVMGAKKDRPLVQIAILLDTSNSMDGLIDQAKAQIWRIVNQFITAKRQGVAPRVQVALYEYGKQSLPSTEGYIRQIVPLSEDLDKVSQELFALKTNGGDEYCGWVIKEATAKLEWSKNDQDYKAIFICGNEPFTQGPVDYRESTKHAIAKGIIVNTIHCGPEAEGIQGKWEDGAKLADGRFICINQDKAVVHIAAPQDEELAKLSRELNGTYVAFGGAQGQAGKQQQQEQDAKAEGMNQAVAAERARTKANDGAYDNARWDMVDAYKKDSKNLTEAPAADLPAEMQKMNSDERKAYIEKKSAERAELQKRIGDLGAAREKYLAEERKKLAGKGETTLDQAVISIVREQCEKKSFKFE